jgi:hypothetical protein
MENRMQDQERAVGHFRELVAVALEGREPTAPDWMMLGCAARDLGIPFDWACRLVSEHRGRIVSRTERQPGVPAQVVTLPADPADQQAPSRAASIAIDAMHPIGSRPEPMRTVPELQPKLSQIPVPEPQASQPEIPSPAPLQLEPEDVEPPEPVTPRAERAPSPVLPPPPVSERMIAIEGGLLMPESYVLVARSLRAKYAEFLYTRLPVIATAAARNARLGIEMYQPSLEVAQSPPLPPPQLGSISGAPFDSLALWWSRNATSATRDELALIGRGAIAIRCAAWRAPVFLSILGWGYIKKEVMVGDGQLRQTVRCNWFDLRPDFVVQSSDTGWTTVPVVNVEDVERNVWQQLLQLTSKSDGPASVHFVKSLVSGLRAESASFAQQRKSLRALTGRIHGAEAAAAVLPANGSLPEIQRAAGAALEALRGALFIAGSASC